MRKGVLFLIFAMVLTMIVPVQVSGLPQKQFPELPIKDDINGKYEVSVKTGEEWNVIGTLSFGKHQSTQTIEVGSYLTNDSLTIKLLQAGGGSAYLDAVLLDGSPALKANSTGGKLLNKLSKVDLDIAPVGDEGVVLEFEDAEEGILTVAGRIENEVISKEPLQFPAENNFKSKAEIEGFYSYTVGSNSGTVKVDGMLGEVSGEEPFVKEYRVPDSGHPAGDIYFWVMNDNENLYVAMDTTPDNTFDGDKDYAKVYVKTGEGIKEFKVSVPETTWGKSGFTYTDKAVYEHKVYEFAIPLSEIDAADNEEISIAFAAYGTMSYDINCDKPALAYDEYNEIYLCVYEHYYAYEDFNQHVIIGEYVDKDGSTIGHRFRIADSEVIKDEDPYIELFDPSVAFEPYNGKFIVTWVENHSNVDYVCAKLIEYGNPTEYEPFIVSSEDMDSCEINTTPEVAYDSRENQFLAVWAERSGNKDCVYGQIIGLDGSRKGGKFYIGTPSEEDQRNPSLAYSESQEAFLVAWQDGEYVSACGVALNGNNNTVSNMVIIGEGWNPNVSYNYSSQRLYVTWENDKILYGKYYDLKPGSGTYPLDPYPVGDLATLSSPHDGYSVAYPSAYYSGSNKDMLCVWSMFKPEQKCFAEFNYVDIYGELDGPSFFTDEDEAERDKISVFNLPIAISGDYKMQNIIAFVTQNGRSIGYRIIGETEPEESILISNNEPDIAYDDDNNIYLSVFEYTESNLNNVPLSTYIYGELVDADGTPISDKFPIRASENHNSCYEPAVAYDKANKNFLVVWSERLDELEDGFSNAIVASTVTVNMSDETFEIGDAYNISGNDFYNQNGIMYSEEEPDLDYGKDGEFLLVWIQSTYDSKNNISKERDIYGRIVDSSDSLNNENFFIRSDHSYYYHQPSVRYNPVDDAFLAAWNYWDEDAEVIGAQSINSSGELVDNGNINIGGNRCNFPNVSLNTSNDQFFVTWHDYSSDKSVIKGQYISLDSELVPVNAGEEIHINMYDEKGGIYPASYGDGNGRMLCAWSSNLLESGIYNPMLQYIDTEGSHSGNAFYPDEYDEGYTTDNLTASTRIAMSGDNNGKVIIAYDYEPAAYRKSNYNSFDYTLNIGYKVFGERETEPYIEFSNAPFEEIIAGDTLQTKVKLYNNEFPNGIEINEDLFFFSEDPEIAEIDRASGLITGITEGETNVYAVYDPEAEYDSDDVKFSEGAVEMKNREKVKVIPKPLSSLKFDKEIYYVQIDKTVPFNVILKNYDDVKEKTVTDIVAYELGNPEIASISTSGAITGLAAGTTTVSAVYTDGEIELKALASIVVNKVPSPSNNSAPPRTPIGQILVDNKVIETIYEEDVRVKNNTYTFTADKAGKSAKLWLDCRFYKDLAGDYPDRIIKFNWNKGTYTLPLSCKEVLDEIDSSAKKVNILIEKVDDSKIIKAAKNSAENMGAEIVSDLVDFSVFIEKNKGNKEIYSLDFYAERTINQLAAINENISTAMKFVEDKEYLTFAPSVFDDDSAAIKYRGNGIFTIIENPQTFNDIANHWAKVNIEKLAARNIAFGKENNNFSPQDFVTRAEFAVMITRALGITEEEGSNDFTDVSNEWFAEDISTAYESGLINGKNDGRFYPNEKIQRKDMAVMIHNALKFAGMNFDVSDAGSVLSMFTDNSSIADYARKSTAACVKAGIIMGRDTNNLDPDSNATRAEASAIIERMLKFLEFMD